MTTHHPDAPMPPTRLRGEPRHGRTGSVPAYGPDARPPGLRGLPRRFWRGHLEDPGWARPGLLGLLAVTAVLYVWDLGASRYANEFYSAAVQAGSESWKAMFFGSSDAANSITVDKPPGALWPMALSVRLFGLSSWSVLVPEALMGVATVGVLYAAVKRHFGPAAGLLAGAVCALTPVAVLMFRFNNPDALLCLLMVCAVYCVLRGLDDARTKWLVLAGVCFGLGFLTKTLQAWLIVPPLALLYVLCAPTRVRRRLAQLLWAGLAMLVSAGWWVAIVELWPKSSRPYIGGSQDNSFLGLTFGYNGFGRITGDEGGRGGGWGGTGFTRLFGADMGGQIAWLLPAAFLLLLAGVWLAWRGRGTDAALLAGERGAFLAWGGALLMTFLTFSFMSGIFHQYYNVALAPYIAALVGMGTVVLWRRRARPAAAVVLGATVALTAVWSYVLLGRTAHWLPWLRWSVLIGGVAAALALLVVARLGRRLAWWAAGVGLAASVGGPVAYVANTVGTPHSGSIVTAGPASGQSGMGMVMRGKKGAGGAFFAAGKQPKKAPGGPQGGAGGGPGGDRRGKGPVLVGVGGLLDGQDISAQAKAAVKADAEDYTWALATVGSHNAASYQLATGKPVMAIGGFNGSDPSPTLDAFKEAVRQGKIHYFAEPERLGGQRQAGYGSAITSWVKANFQKVKEGKSTLYDLTKPKAQKES
ncbi:glycosyltransferase family 39 protein [Streptomyces sp. NPDC050610]|uniref:ArnT family glycosyltransferase n=1 Tax=Streptomyces sp. NPDC050610 TaxID=3157097 RepID=UPI00343FDCD8